MLATTRFGSGFFLALLMVSVGSFYRPTPVFCADAASIEPQLAEASPFNRLHCTNLNDCNLDVDVCQHLIILCAARAGLDKVDAKTVQALEPYTSGDICRDETPPKYPRGRRDRLNRLNKYLAGVEKDYRLQQALLRTALAGWESLGIDHEVFVFAEREQRILVTMLRHQKHDIRAEMKELQAVEDGAISKND